jgi:hypothetical protein
MNTITLSPSLAAYIDEAGDFGGFSFNAKVIEAAPVDRTDWKTIAERFNPSYQLIAAHTTTAAPVVSIRFSKA